MTRADGAVLVTAMGAKICPAVIDRHEVAVHSKGGDWRDISNRLAHLDLVEFELLSLGVL